MNSASSECIKKQNAEQKNPASFECIKISVLLECIVNTALTWLRWNGEHEDIDQSQNKHRQQHGQHQKGGTSPESDLVVDPLDLYAVLYEDHPPCPGSQKLPLSIGHKGV